MQRRRVLDTVYLFGSATELQPFLVESFNHLLELSPQSIFLSTNMMNSWSLSEIGHRGSRSTIAGVTVTNDDLVALSQGSSGDSDIKVGSLALPGIIPKEE